MLKETEAVLAGFALVSVMMAGAFTQSPPPINFFVNSKTGQPHLLIVVGSRAAASDVEAATMLAVKVGTLDVVRATYCNSNVEKIPVSTQSLVALDTQITLSELKSDKRNLVFIGGPVANMMVKQLVGDGLSLVDWVMSPGEWEYIKAPYGGCDILIIAGRDREATVAAVHVLTDQL